jgi:tetratricopeptide (TPR) repeat protein
MGVIFWLLLLLVPVAQAQDEARTLYANGKMLFDEGNYERALEAWAKAYELSEKPVLLYNIALVQEKLGDLVAAIDTLERYRIYAPQEDQAALVQKIEELKAQLAATAVSEPEPIVLEPEPEAPPATQEAAAPEPAESSARRTGIIIAWSTSGAALGSGVLFALKASGHEDSASSNCASGGGRLVCRKSAADAIASARQAAVLADISWGVSALAGGTAVWLMLRPQTDTTQTGLRLWWAGQKAGIRGRF